ncbi:hypothetical protein [Microbulbifer celer]|uniref:DUF5056 domain-containing protein n=1 Tax=Microbulbifer celer TaxID=435905 RepID=A0ABW3U7Y4_9GAMM|nr:hypothetical protein [Microbulbifer celer]UFN58626.1 hypothetical protein LPW13_06175 [Microbulbifer celer]
MANSRTFGTEVTGTESGMVGKDGMVDMPSGAGDEPDFDTWLSQQLQFNEPHLDNDGFCEQVMAALPAVPARRAQRRASRFQYGAVIAASAIVCWQFPLESVLAQLAQQSISLYSLLGVGALASLVAMTGGIVAARR